jgi:hypothetical protein
MAAPADSESQLNVDREGEGGGVSVDDQTGKSGGQPVVILGVSRSGTTLLKEMLNGHSALAIPSESYFIPQLWARHGEHPDCEAFLADLGRLARIKEWGLTPELIGRQMPAEPEFAEAVQAIYLAHAQLHGKSRFGDKTPAYMQCLSLLERAFPDARYVHLIRDGRDAGLSFVAMRRRPRFNWARPRGLGAFAAQWRREVATAQAFGRGPAEGRYLEIRYDALVTEPEATLGTICSFLGLEFESQMLEYHRRFSTGQPVDHASLSRPPDANVRRWREQMSERDQRHFEAIAGELLEALGYERRYPTPGFGARIRARFERAALAVRIASFDAALTVARKGPIWRLRQVYMRRTHVEGTP